MLIELSATSYIGIKASGISNTNRDDFPYQYRQIQALLNKRENTDNDFYRTDTDIFYNRNEPYLYGYSGVSLFSSTTNTDIVKFMLGLGLYGNRQTHNFFTYVDTSPLTSTFINMRYMVSHLSENLDKSVYWKSIGKIGDSLLLENKYYLPLGFMINSQLIEYRQHVNPFVSQNNFFHLATGLPGNLFTIYDISSLGDNNNERNITTWSYQVPITGMSYACCMILKPDFHEQMEININGTVFPTFPMDDCSPYIFTLGNVIQGDDITFSLEIDKAALYVGHLNSELFEQGYNLLTRAPLKLTKFTNTQVCGNVTALEDGLLYTSIPGDKNWNVFIDGVKSKILLIDNAMIAVSLNKGYHEIEFRYFNKSFLVGIIVSLISLGLFVAMVLKNPTIHDSL